MIYQQGICQRHLKSWSIRARPAALRILILLIRKSTWEAEWQKVSLTLED